MILWQKARKVTSEPPKSSDRQGVSLIDHVTGFGPVDGIGIIIVMFG